MRGLSSLNGLDNAINSCKRHEIILKCIKFKAPVNIIYIAAL